MAYPKPTTSLKNLSIKNKKGGTIILQDRQGTPIEFSYYKNIGWEIEVRYDTINPLFCRQPYTGKQSKLKKNFLASVNDKKKIQIQGSDSNIILDPTYGQFAITNPNNEKVFETIAIPFSYHKKPVQIYENLMSTKITDFSSRAPFTPKGELFATHMVRFQYPRPQGIVLGIPGQSGEANRNGYRFELYNTDNYLHTPNRNPLYQSWPILFHKNASGSGWLCIFHDNPSRTFIDVGDFYENLITFEALTDNARVYILFDTTLEKVAHKLSLLLGTTQFPPLWAFGYQQCRFSYMNTAELRHVAKKMEENNIPLDAIYCDIDMFDGFRVFTKDKKAFSDLHKVSKKLLAKNIRTITIIDPGVKIDDQFSVYQQLKKSGGYLKNPDGSAFIAKVWPGKSLFPDFSNPKIQAWWAGLQKKWVKENNLNGIWNDMNEPSNFDGMTRTTSQSRWSHGELKNEYNLYGYYMAKASAMGWEKTHPNKRGLIISRSGYPGVQQHAVIWHGDNHAWWEHLRLALNTAVAYSLCGAYYTGADVPGFTGNPPDDLAIRFFQLGAFLPFFRGHSIFFAKDKEPFSFKKETKHYIKQAIMLRYSLLREWYSGFAQAIQEKQSPLMPVFDSGQSYIPDEFTLFGKFLIAPILERDQKKRLIYLPPGNWYTLGDTENPQNGDSWITVDADLSVIPVYVKAGTILTRNKVGKTTIETLKNPERFEVYQNRNGRAEGYWYTDDGLSKKDKKGKFKKLVSFRDKQSRRLFFDRLPH